MTPARTESAPRVGPHQRGGQSARPENQRQVRCLLLREAAGDAALGGDPLLDRRHRLDPVVHDDRQAAPDICAGEIPELARALPVEGEADRRLVVLVYRGSRGAQIPAGDPRQAPHQVVVGRAQRCVHRGHDLQVRRQDAASRLQQHLARRRRSVLDQLDLEQPRAADDRLRALDIRDTRQLYQDLVAEPTVCAAVRRDDRLGHTKLVDTTLDRLQRLPHRLLAQHPLSTREHPIGVGATRLHLAVVDRPQQLVGDILKVPDPLGGHTFDPYLGRRDRRDRGQHDAVDNRLLAQRLGAGLGLDQQRVVGLHLHHQMRTATQVQTQTDLLRRRVDRKDSQPHHADDQQHLPAQVLRHDVFLSRGLRPEPRAGAARGPQSPTPRPRGAHVRALPVVSLGYALTTSTRNPAPPGPVPEARPLPRVRPRSGPCRRLAVAPSARSSS